MRSMTEFLDFDFTLDPLLLTSASGNIHTFGAFLDLFLRRRLLRQLP